MTTIRKQHEATLGILACALVLSLVCATAWSATYYVDPAGSDSNNGTSTSTAWKTLNKVNNTLFSAGDSILLKRGGTWHEQLIVSSNGSVSSAITFGAYGSGDKPVIVPTSSVTGWTSAGSNLYTAAVASSPEVVVFNGVKGNRESSVSGVNAANDWYWTGGTLTVYATSVPSNVEAATVQFALAAGGKSYVTMKDMTVRNGFYPVLLYNSSNVTLDNLTVCDGAGAAGIFVVGEDASKAESNTISNCAVYGITGSTDTIADVNNGCGIYLYGVTAQKNTISGNTVHDCGHEGIAILSGSYNVVSKNSVYRSAGAGIRVALETATGNIVEGNESYQNCLKTDDRFGIDLIRVGNDNVVRYNKVHDQYDTLNDSSVAADPTNSGAKYGTGGIRFDGGNWEGHDSMDSTGNKAYYNVIFNERFGIESFNFSNIEMYNNAIYNSLSYGITISSVFSVVCANNVMKNNVIHTAGQGLVYHYRMTNTVIDNNVYYPDSATAFLWRVDSSYYTSNFAGWKSRSGLDANSRAADPLFTSAASCDFSLRSGSACVNAGVNVGLSSDFAKTSVPQGGAPDAGAYELVSAATDTTAPVITMLGSSPITVQVGATYSDAGATATDNSDGSLTAKIVTSNNVNTSVVGTYAVTYSVSDAAGNAAVTVTRTVNVVDTIKPAITLTGSAAVSMQAGSTYTDAGATATDNYDGNITSKIVKSGTVNTAVAGSYILTYNVSDASGNAATPVTRTVTVNGMTTVADTTKPVITLLGSSTLKWKWGVTYVDPGATATDNVDGNITSKVVATSSVNVKWPGTYYVTYNVKDAAGNAAIAVTRTVKVTLTGKEGEADSDLFITSPAQGSTYYAAGTSQKALLTLTAHAPVTATSVSYTFDGVNVGSSESAPYTLTVELDLASLAYGQHVVGATATLQDTTETLTTESTFTFAPAPQSEDANTNGLPDNPFAILTSDGDAWVQPIVNAANGGKRAAAVTRFEGMGSDSSVDASVAISLDNPNDSSRGVTVQVPRSLLADGETGIAIVQIADDLETLFGADAASKFQSQPEGLALADGGQYMQVSVITSTDGGATFTEIDPARLAAHPVHLEAWGMTEGAALYRHPTFVDSDSTTGLLVSGDEGDWSAANDAVAGADGVKADLTALSVFVVFRVVSDCPGQTPVAGCVGGTFSGSFNTPALGDVFLMALGALAILAANKRMSAVRLEKRS